MYHWKETIGDIARRPGAWSKWPPNYRSDGLGFHEFLELCEYLGSDAMYVTSTGMVCTSWVERDENKVFFHKETDVNYYINDVLDAIEYAIGSVTTKWGAERAKNGHPKPFPLKYVEIGNEDFGPVYYEKYDQISKAIKAKYPNLRLIANSIIFAIEDDKRKYIPEFISPESIEIFDEHYYQSVDWAINGHYKFDAYQRKGPDLFIGELGLSGKYPTQILAEGIVKLSMERNGDLNPIMADRPLMRNFDFLEGRTAYPLLLHNALISVKTFNYHLCKMFRDNKIDIYYTTTVNHQSGLYATSGSDSKTQNYIFKVINLSDEEQDIRIEAPELKDSGNVIVTLLTAKGDQAATPDHPDIVFPQVREQKVSFPLNEKLPPHSFVIYRVKM
jgi:alpha-L-arabinofuranosidase